MPAHPTTLQQSVRVENLNPNIKVVEVEDFFRSKIGHVIDVREHVIASTLHRWIEVAFDTEEAAKQAITLTGQTFHGLPIYVGQLFDPDLLEDSPPKASVSAATDETRRNLYVLGLPHDFTLDEFKALFLPYGEIEHAVILAVLDNFSRRRGFVVFSSHTQARTAMRAVHKTTVKGHQLNVSWAVVQRSSGFLDGADRTAETVPDAASGIKKQLKPNRVNNPFAGVAFSSFSNEPQNTPSAGNPVDKNKDMLSGSHPPIGFSMEGLGTAFASTLLVSNLCPWLFQSHIDIHALFAPYGFVKRITIIPPSPSVAVQAHCPHAALVEYDDLQNALSALYQVNGRPFGTCIARASLFRDAMQRAMLMQGAQDSNTSRQIDSLVDSSPHSAPQPSLHRSLKSPVDINLNAPLNVNVH